MEDQVAIMASHREWEWYMSGSWHPMPSIKGIAHSLVGTAFLCLHQIMVSGSLFLSLSALKCSSQLCGTWHASFGDI